MRRLNQDELLEKRIREIKRKILHEHDSKTRQIYKEHIEFLKSERNMEVVKNEKIFY